MINKILNNELKALIEEVLTDFRIKSISIDWKEMGEFQGDDIRPVIKIEKY
jgi:hypothetical protein